MKAAARLEGLGTSPIRTLSEGAPADAVPLGLGEPTWPMPEVARRALARFGGVCSYGPQGGRVELLDAIAAYHGADAPRSIERSRVLVTSGAQEALYSIAQAFLGPGDAALVPDPGFVGYGRVVRLAGGDPVPYPLPAGARFRLDAGALIAVLERTPAARMVLLGHPSNPTGAGASPEALAEVAAACRERGVVLVSDEVYRELYFEARPASLLQVADDALVVSSVSKGFGSPGLRVGWIVGPEALLAPVRVVHGYAVTCASAPAQLAARAMLEASDSVLRDARRELAARFEALAGAMQEHLGRRIEPPDGGFYHTLPIPAGSQADPVAWCLRLRDEARVVLIPGLAFGEGGRGFARLSFAARPEELVEGVRRLAAFERAG